jgi:hypothetical protein
MGFIGACCCAAACNPSTSPVGSKYVVSQLVTAKAGGTVTVKASDDPNLAGTSIQIPPNALPVDTTITIAEGAAIANIASAGPVADFGPSGTAFSYPVTITLPYTAGTVASTLTVVGVESDTSTLPSVSIGNADLTIDASANTLSFKAVSFTRYGAASGSSQPCPLNETFCGCNGSGICIASGVACPAICPADAGTGCTGPLPPCAFGLQPVCQPNGQWTCSGGGCCPAGQYLCGCGNGTGTCVPDNVACVVNCPAQPSNGSGGACACACPANDPTCTCDCDAGSPTVDAGPAPVSVCCPANEYFCGCNGQGSCIADDQACPQVCIADAGVPPPASCCPSGQYFCGCGNGSGSCVADGTSCIVNCPNEPAGTAPAATCCPANEYFCGCGSVGECIPDNTACPIACPVNPDGGVGCSCACPANDATCACACDGGAGGGCPSGEYLCNGACVPNGQPCAVCGCACPANDPTCACGCDGGSTGGCPAGEALCNGLCQPSGEPCGVGVDAGGPGGCGCACPANDPTCVCDCDAGSPTCTGAPPPCAIGLQAVCLPDGQWTCSGGGASDAGSGCVCSCPANDPTCACACDGGSSTGCPAGDTLCCNGTCAPPGAVCPTDCPLDGGSGL